MNKKYKNYGEIDYEDHEIENKIELDEKLNKELDPDENETTNR